MNDSKVAAGQRMTRQRKAVMAALESLKDVRSAQQIHKDMADEGHSVGLATVYRNLQLLAQVGMIESIRAEDGEYLYLACDEDKHHHHLVCRRCNSTVDIAGDSVEHFVQQVAQVNGFTQVQHSFDLFGICPSCTEELKNKTQHS